MGINMFLQAQAVLKCNKNKWIPLQSLLALFIFLLSPVAYAAFPSWIDTSTNRISSCAGPSDGGDMTIGGVAYNGAFSPVMYLDNFDSTSIHGWNANEVQNSLAVNSAIGSVGSTHVYSDSVFPSQEYYASSSLTFRTPRINGLTNDVTSTGISLGNNPDSGGISQGTVYVITPEKNWSSRDYMRTDPDGDGVGHRGHGFTLQIDAISGTGTSNAEMVAVRYRVAGGAWQPANIEMLSNVVAANIDSTSVNWNNDASFTDLPATPVAGVAGTAPNGTAVFYTDDLWDEVQLFFVGSQGGITSDNASWCMAEQNNGDYIPLEVRKTRNPNGSTDEEGGSNNYAISVYNYNNYPVAFNLYDDALQGLLLNTSAADINLSSWWNVPTGSRSQLNPSKLGYANVGGFNLYTSQYNGQTSDTLSHTVVIMPNKLIGMSFPLAVNDPLSGCELNPKDPQDAVNTVRVTTVDLDVSDNNEVPTSGFVPTPFANDTDGDLAFSPINEWNANNSSQGVVDALVQTPLSCRAPSSLNANKESIEAIIEPGGTIHYGLAMAVNRTLGDGLSDGIDGMDILIEDTLPSGFTVADVEFGSTAWANIRPEGMYFAGKNRAHHSDEIYTLNNTPGNIGEHCFEIRDPDNPNTGGPNGNGLIGTPDTTINNQLRFIVRVIAEDSECIFGAFYKLKVPTTGIADETVLTNTASYTVLDSDSISPTPEVHTKDVVYDTGSTGLSVEKNAYETASFVPTDRSTWQEVTEISPGVFYTYYFKIELDADSPSATSLNNSRYIERDYYLSGNGVHTHQYSSQTSVDALGSSFGLTNLLGPIYNTAHMIDSSAAAGSRTGRWTHIGPNYLWINGSVNMQAGDVIEYAEQLVYDDVIVPGDVVENNYCIHPRLLIDLGLTGNGVTRGDFQWIEDSICDPLALPVAQGKASLLNHGNRLIAGAGDADPSSFDDIVNIDLNFINTSINNRAYCVSDRFEDELPSLVENNSAAPLCHSSAETYSREPVEFGSVSSSSATDPDCQLAGADPHPTWITGVNSSTSNLLPHGASGGYEHRFCSNLPYGNAAGDVFSYRYEIPTTAQPGDVFTNVADIYLRPETTHIESLAIDPWDSANNIKIGTEEFNQ